MANPTACVALFDLVTIVPFIGWFIMSLYAIPSYAREGWMAPIVLAIGSSILSLVATREFWLRSHVVRSKMLYVVLNETQAKERAEKTNAAQKTKGLVAAFFTVLCLVWTILFLAAEYGSVNPAEQAGMPCGCELWKARNNGTDHCCHLCDADPLCLNWAAALKQSSPLVGICSPSTSAADLPTTEKNATFSCAADGFWMLVTTFFALFWFVIVRCRSPVKTSPTGSVVPGTGTV